MTLILDSSTSNTTDAITTTKDWFIIGSSTSRTTYSTASTFYDSNTHEFREGDTSPIYLTINATSSTFSQNVNISGDLTVGGSLNLGDDTIYGLPIGSVISYCGSISPAGYLFCDGSPISRTTYSQLFSEIGTTYGTGDGSTTFNLPNLNGRTIVGKSTDTEFNTLGEMGGGKTHELTEKRNYPHIHIQ